MIEKVIIYTHNKFAWLWRIGLIDRTTAFRWEVDAALGEREDKQ